MTPKLFSLVIEQHHEELRRWARCCAQGDSPSLVRSSFVRVVGSLPSRLRPAPARRSCCA
jgi:hypothetical protein